MERDLRLLGSVAGIRAFGYFLFEPFLALYLRNVVGLDYAVVGTLIFLYLLPSLILTPVGGLLADRVGRRRLLLLSLQGEAAGLLILADAMASGSLVVISAAAVVGFLFGTIGGPANSAYVADLAEGSERTKGFTWIRVGFNAGAGAGVAAGGFLVGTVGFPLVTALASLVLAAACALVALLLRASPFDLRLREHRKATSVPEGTVLTGSTPPPSVTASLRVLAKDRLFLETCLAFGLASLATGQWAFTLPLFVNTKLGIPYDLLGIGIALNALLVVVGQVPTTRALLGRRHTWIGQVGLLLYAAAFMGLGVAGEWNVLPVGIFIASVVVSTMGENFVAIPQNTLPSNMAPAAEIGNYNGAFQLVGSAGFQTAALFGGLVLSATPDPLLEWAIMLAPAVPSVLLLRRIARRIPEAADRA